MKKIMVSITAAVMAIGAATMGVLTNTASAEKSNISMDYVSAFSKDKEQTAEKSSTSAVNYQSGSRSYFIDSNNDGICDNRVDGVYPQNVTGNEYRCGNGNYVDENNDGICDNCADGLCPQNVTGNGYRRGNGNYVDENNDGICDNRANRLCPQNGTGNGYRRGNGGGRGRTGV